MSEHQVKHYIYTYIYIYIHSFSFFVRNFLRYWDWKGALDSWGSNYGPVLRSGKHVMQIRGTLHLVSWESVKFQVEPCSVELFIKQITIITFQISKSFLACHSKSEIPAVLASFLRLDIHSYWYCFIRSLQILPQRVRSSNSSSFSSNLCFS